MKKLFCGWNTIRLVRLLIGLALGVYALAGKDYLFLFLAGLFIMQSLLNVSCCGAGGCASGREKQREGVYKGQIKKYKG